jgi:hypothetical protein
MRIHRLAQRRDDRPADHLPCSRANGYTVGDGMAKQVIQRTSLAITSQPRVLDVALDDATGLVEANSTSKRY